MKMLPVENGGKQNQEAVKFDTTRELIQAISARYHFSGHSEKNTILDEFVETTGFHRKHAIRALQRASEVTHQNRLAGDYPFTTWGWWKR